MLKKATDIRRAAMDLLARREHGVEELTRKLRQRGADPESIAVELQKLVDEGLLSEQRYLESYVRSRANAGRGPARIREELLHRGLSRSAIEQALAEAETDWQKNMHDLWQRKFGEAPVDSKEYARQMRFLLYRGFSAEQAQRLLREISKQGDEY